MTEIIRRSSHTKMHFRFRKMPMPILIIDRENLRCLERRHRRAHLTPPSTGTVIRGWCRLSPGFHTPSTMPAASWLGSSLRPRHVPVWPQVVPIHACNALGQLLQRCPSAVLRVRRMQPVRLPFGGNRSAQSDPLDESNKQLSSHRSNGF